MDIPILIDGVREGVITVSRQGADRILTARLRDVGRVVRLTVYGAGEAYYLGVPVPENGELRLTRRLSPGEQRRFPERPEYAAEERAPDAPGHVLWLGGRPWYF